MSRRNQINRLVFDLAPMRLVGRRIYATRRTRQIPAQSTATKFFRNLDQFAAFAGPLRPLVETGRMRVLVVGCSMGCEAFTLAGFLVNRFPGLDVQIQANDISQEALAVAKAGIYGREHGLGSGVGGLVGDLEDVMFNRDGDTWRVVKELRTRVSFDYADALSPEFSQFNGFDVVLGQNFMIHMDARQEAQAFANLVGAARAGGALFLGGMDLDRRPSLVESHQLQPLDWNVAAIHDGDEMRRSAWPWAYWSLEPLNWGSPDFLARYATIFWKPAGTKC
jgi:SAM-dependent methyltransferase